MLQICLQDSATANRLDLPGRSFIRLSGPSARTPGDRELVRLEENGWRVGERVFDTLRFDSPSTVRFGSARHSSDRYGPFEEVRVVGHEVHVKNGSNHVLAEFHDDGQRWRCGDDIWSLMVVTQSAMDVETE
jgi:hypothetical protein